MSIEISIEERDKTLVFDLFEASGEDVNKYLVNKQRKIISEGVSFQYKHHYICMSESIPSLLVISVEIGKNVVLPIAVGILSNYLYEKLKNRKNKTVRINGVQVEIDQKKIEQAILTNYEPTQNNRE